MARIIATSVSNGVTLDPGDNPVTITPSGYVSGPDGIDGAAGTSFTITNQSTVIGTVQYGISLGQGGTITNATGALISGPGGVQMSAGDTTPGLIDNYGQITGGTGYAIYMATVGSVTNEATGVIVGSSGIKIAGTNALIVNLGQITGTYGSPPGYGIHLRESGTVVNGQGGPSTATIEGYTGIAFKSNPITLPGTLYNYGTIIGTGSVQSAVAAQGDGLLINGGSGATAALIQGGRYGVYFNGAGTITNYATIRAIGTYGGDYGVAVDSGLARVTNLGPSGYISGYVGVNVAYGIVTNSGTIASTQGASGTAVHFVGGTNLLVVDPSGVFIGTVVGAGFNSNTIELSGSVASTISNLGTSFTNFGTVLVDAGATWTMAGVNSIHDTLTTGEVTIGAGAYLAITGALNTGDAFTLNGGSLDIAGAVDPASSFDLSGGTAESLRFDSVTGTSFANAIVGFGDQDVITLPDVAFDPNGSVTADNGTLSVPLLNGDTFTFSDFSTQGTPIFQLSGDSITDIACFAAGTRIRTEHGDVAVEKLRVGDGVILADGRIEPIIWLGHRTVDCAHHPEPETVWPVRVRAGALAPGLPVRDLVLSPEHALFLRDVMMPVRVLINGSSIAQERDAKIAYYHLELPRHEVVLAEGVATESYLDTGNRSSFLGSKITSLFANFGVLSWEISGCAPLVVAGPEVTAARAQIAARAAEGQFAAAG